MAITTMNTYVKLQILHQTSYIVLNVHKHIVASIYQSGLVMLQTSSLLDRNTLRIIAAKKPWKGRANEQLIKMLETAI